MEHATDTWIVSPNRPVAGTLRGACLVHIYPTGPCMGHRYLLDEQPLCIGRGEECEILIPDHTVSRKHARVEFTGSGYQVADLKSTNGTFVNDTPVSLAALHDGDYLRTGKSIFRFLVGGNVEAEYHEEIYRLTIIDALTQVHNQRYFLEFLDRELIRSGRYHRPLGLVLIDIDRFKTVNDDLGHLGGDFALRELSDVIRKGIRREDLFARYGGEEFGLILVETGLAAAVEVAERLRQTVEQHPFQFEQQGFHLTVSLGVAATAGDSILNAQELIRRADESLFQAKRNGRNRVVSG